MSNSNFFWRETVRCATNSNEKRKRLGIGDRVIFLGDRRDIPAVMASLDVAVLTSDSESLSNVILEAMVCIGTGGSVGRTGPVIALCAAAGARLARATGTNPARMRLLVAAGAAGGLAASYNAPLGGACFALEVVLHTVAADAFAAVLPAALTAAAVGRALTGDTRLFALPDFPVPGAGNYLLYAVTGLAGGVLGATFSATLRRTVHSYDALWHNRPAWARPIVGGVFLGAVLLALPPLYGVGIPCYYRPCPGPLHPGDAAGADGREDNSPASPSVSADTVEYSCPPCSSGPWAVVRSVLLCTSTFREFPGHRVTTPCSA